PYPTSTATTRAAPRWSRQSVNPPVDAPASRQSRPSGATAKRSSAAASLPPPRETKDGGGPESATGASSATSDAALVAVIPATVTRPALTASCAWDRLAASPRRTSSASRRRRPIVEARYAFPLVDVFFAAVFLDEVRLADVFFAAARRPPDAVMPAARSSSRTRLRSAS